MPHVFLIPPSCSHTTLSKTNVYLITIQDAPQDSKETLSWEKFEQQNPDRPLLIMIYDGCEDWENRGTFGPAELRDFRTAERSGGKQARKKCMVIYVNEDIRKFDSITDAFAGQASIP